MNKTYHDMIEEAYFGRVRNFHGYGVSVQIGALRNDPQRLTRLVTMPSYHFGTLLSDMAEQLGDATKPVPLHIVAKHMDDLDCDRLAVVFDIAFSEDTCIVEFDRESGVLKTDLCLYDAKGNLSGKAGCWLTFLQHFVAKEGAPLVWAASVGLELLANPMIEFAMAKSPDGVAKMSAGRIKRGDRAVEPMKVIRLTKKVYLGGCAIYPRGAPSGGERSPHDRSGHYRHSNRAHPGWEGPLIETSGEWKGVICYRRWIEDTQVKGGAVGEEPGLGNPNAAPTTAQQFRVVM